MTTALLDINDCNLQLWHAEKHLQSPGYALLEGREYLFGSTARGAARLRPRDINTRFWWQLNTEALQPALGPARHTADLVHAHLLALHREAGEPPEVVIAAPGSMQRDQLALLLGIVQQCPFDAVGLINRSTLLASLHGGGGRLFHLELQLHQALLAELEPSGQDIELQRSTPLPGCGLLQLQERLVSVIAASFISQTRFDPRRKAATEQSLYDALPGLLQALAQAPEANIEVNGYRARITHKDLESTASRLAEGAVQAMGGANAGDNMIVDPLVGLIPGLRGHFAGFQVAAPDALWQASQLHGEGLLRRGQPLSFTSKLPALHSDHVAAIEPAAVPPAAAAIAEPTHLLRGHTAIALAAEGTALDDGIEIYRADEGWRIRGGSCKVNGKPCEARQVIAAGDRLTCSGGSDYRLIEVLPPGA